MLASHLRNMEGNPFVFDIVVHTMETQSDSIRTFHAWLTGAVQAIVEAGVSDGSFIVDDREQTARVLLTCLEGATHPLLIRHLDRTVLAARLEEMIRFLTASLRGSLAK